jgi:hypothetical protein
MTFVAVYMSILVFQTYWGIATIRDNRWGTRDARVDGSDPDADVVRVFGRTEAAPVYTDAVELSDWDEMLPGQLSAALVDVT